MKKILLIALLVSVFAPALTAQTTLTGDWNAKFTRTAPDGRTQSINFIFSFKQKGKELTGTIGPATDERRWNIEKGVVAGNKVTFQVQQPDGPLRSFALTLEKGRLTGPQTLAFNGQTAEVTVEAERAKEVKK